MTRIARRFFAALLVLSCSRSAFADDVTEPAPPHARWMNESALTTAPGRLEIGLFSRSSWGVTDWLELRLHPLFVFVLPHVAGKIRWWDSAGWHLASEHAVTVPTPFQSLLAREGTLGLLPPNEPVGVAVMSDDEIVLSRQVTADHVLTGRAGFQVALRSRDPVLLDFPFLYQRFAVLNAPWVPHVGVGVAGTAAEFSYEITSTAFYLPLTDLPKGYAWETNLELGWSFSESFRLAASTRVAWARFPIGDRWHVLPLLDVRAAFR